jgi:putative sterol carrier protein
MHDLFSRDGLVAWRRHLEATPEFARAARGWSGTLVLREGDATDRARRAWVALADGAITEMRQGTVADEAAAEFVLAASIATWEALVAGERELATAALAGELRLEVGSVLRLLPHIGAAAALLRAASLD